MLVQLYLVMIFLLWFTTHFFYWKMPLQLCEPGGNPLPLLYLCLPLLQEELEVNPGDEGPLHHHWRDWKPQQLIILIKLMIHKQWVITLVMMLSKRLHPLIKFWLIRVISKLFIDKKGIFWLWLLCDRNQSWVMVPVCFLCSSRVRFQIWAAYLINMRVSITRPWCCNHLIILRVRKHCYKWYCLIILFFIFYKITDYLVVATKMNLLALTYIFSFERRIHLDR